jgi:replicative DNA helicase
VGYKAEAGPDVMASQVDELWQTFKSENTSSTELISPEMAGNDVLNLVEKYGEPGHAPSWGFKNLDDITAGIYPEYVIIGARPSVGKTQLILDIAEQLVHQGQHVFVASAEMQDNQIYERKLAASLGISILQLRKFGMSEDQQTKVVELAGDISESTIHYLSGDLYFRNVYKEACFLKDKGKLDIVFLDYIGALRDCYAENKDSQTTRVSRISNKIQAAVHELKVPWVIASQLNREVEHRNDGFKKQVKSRKPQLSDLRDSGSLEQDADVIFLLHRDEDENGEVSPILKVKMAKNRQLGTAKSVELLYNYNLRRYVDYTNRTEGE